MFAINNAVSTLGGDLGRVDTVFNLKVGDRVLLWTKELLDAADIGKLHPP